VLLAESFRVGAGEVLSERLDGAGSDEGNDAAAEPAARLNER
jgi:hypothetical protein